MIDVNTLFFNHAKTKDEIEMTFDLPALISTVSVFSRLSNQSCFLIDFDEHKILYKTQSLIYLDEVTLDDLQRECANPYWSYISDETLDKLLQIKNHYLLASEDLNLDEYANHVCTIDYPILIRSHELFINQKFTPLVMRSDGITKIGLFTINYSTKKEMESTIITPSGKRFRFDFKQRKYQIFDIGISLSLVEKAILHRARKGMTSKEIAASLYITESTVKTHRNRIFKKLNVETITEALAFIGNYQLI